MMKQASAAIKQPTDLRKKHMPMGTLELTLLAMPAVLILFVFNYIPIFGIVIAFKDFRYDKGIFASDWVGFKNFEFFLKSQDAWRITRNTLGLNALFIVTSLFMAVFIALVLFEVHKRALIKVYQTSMIFPYFISWVVAGYIFYALMNPKFGALNRILGLLGVAPINWYSEPNHWPVILMITNIWKTAGWSSLVYYATLMGIDQSYYEAAQLDGATKFNMITQISIPFLVPMITIMTILNIGNIFRADFGMFYYLTKGIGTLFPTTDVIDTYVYRSLTSVGDIGMSAAAGLYQSVVGFFLVVVTNLIVKKIEPDNALF